MWCVQFQEEALVLRHLGYSEYIEAIEAVCAS